MIYTVTLNPAIDLVIVTQSLRPNVVNRTQKFELQPNGKGVNVSFILKKMNIESIATGIGGGFTLDYVCQGLEDQGIEAKFVRVKDPTRVNVFTRVIDDDVEYKEVNPGPRITSVVKQQYLRYLEDSLKENDTVIVSGSFSTGIPPEYIVEIAKIVYSKRGKLIIDTSYMKVLDTLKYKPFLLKPNDSELATWFGKQNPNNLEIKDMAKSLIAKGAQNVLVSLGAKGAMLVNKDVVYFANAPKIKVLNSAGSGDTMLATFVGSISKGNSYKDALKFATAAASDTASRVGLTDFDRVDELLKEIKIEEE